MVHLDCMKVTRATVQDILHFSAWRWCLFFGLFVPVYWTSRLIIHLLVMLVEARLMTKSRCATCHWRSVMVDQALTSGAKHGPSAWALIAPRHEHLLPWHWTRLM